MYVHVYRYDSCVFARHSLHICPPPILTVTEYDVVPVG